MICETCLEAAFDAGHGDLKSNERAAAFIARKNGRQFAPHECEDPDCECSCLDEYERSYME